MSYSYRKTPNQLRNDMVRNIDVIRVVRDPENWKQSENGTWYHQVKKLAIVEKYYYNNATLDKLGRGQRGSVIDYCINELGMDMDEARTYLREFLDDELKPIYDKYSKATAAFNPFDYFKPSEPKDPLEQLMKELEASFEDVDLRIS